MTGDVDKEYSGTSNERARRFANEDEYRLVRPGRATDEERGYIMQRNCQVLSKRYYEYDGIRIFPELSNMKARVILRGHLKLLIDDTGRQEPQ